MICHIDAHFRKVQQQVFDSEWAKHHPWNNGSIEFRFEYVLASPKGTEVPVSNVETLQLPG